MVSQVNGLLIRPAKLFKVMRCFYRIIGLVIRQASHAFKGAICPTILVSYGLFYVRVCMKGTLNIRIKVHLSNVNLEEFILLSTLPNWLNNFENYGIYYIVGGNQKYQISKSDCHDLKTK